MLLTSMLPNLQLASASKHNHYKMSRQSFISIIFYQIINVFYCSSSVHDFFLARNKLHVIIVRLLQLNIANNG
jgi:hypothetical protein